VIFIVFSLALDFLSLILSVKKLSKSSKRMKENRSKTKNYTKYSDVYSNNIDTKTHLGRMKKRGKKCTKIRKNKFEKKRTNLQRK